MSKRVCVHDEQGNVLFTVNKQEICAMEAWATAMDLIAPENALAPDYEDEPQQPKKKSKRCKLSLIHI